MARFRRKGVGWHTPPSLNALMDEIEEWDPTPRKADGTLGDADHSNRVSDHNPDANGVVRACDAGESDDSQGDYLAEKVRASKDNRVAYHIHDGQIFFGAKYPNLGSRKPWTWYKYTGPNSHSTHNHTSVMRGTSYDKDGSAWNLGLGVTTPPLPKEDTLLPITPTSASQDIGHVQDLMSEAGLTPAGFKVDGKYGPATAAVVKANLLTFTGADEDPNSPQALKDGYIINFNMYNGLLRLWVQKVAPSGAAHTHKATVTSTVTLK